MPRFYFHLRNQMSVDDDEGIELPDLAAARERAEQYAVHMSAVSVVEERKLTLHHHIRVADERGETLFKVTFGDVISVET